MRGQPSDSLPLCLEKSTLQPRRARRSHAMPGHAMPGHANNDCADDRNNLPCTLSIAPIVDYLPVMFVYYAA
jgi:hypothetical protein